MEDTLINELSQLNKTEKIIFVERLQTLDEDQAKGKSWDEIREKQL